MNIITQEKISERNRTSVIKKKKERWQRESINIKR